MLLRWMSCALLLAAVATNARGGTELAFDIQIVNCSGSVALSGMEVEITSPFTEVRVTNIGGIVGVIDDLDLIAPYPDITVEFDLKGASGNTYSFDVVATYDAANDKYVVDSVALDAASIEICAYGSTSDRVWIRTSDH